MSAEARVKELGLDLPSAGRALGVYKPIVVVKGLAYLSGHGPVAADGKAVCGRLGENLDRTAGYTAARQTALNVLAALRQRCGSLDHVRRLVKTTGFVQATPDFTEHPAVINGFSELIRDVFGPDAGVGARSAVGVPSLPAGWAVEIEAIFEIEGD
jgi:enamine deaminase RidA (YjgF/YER057c/UK114 family)